MNKEEAIEIFKKFCEIGQGITYIDDVVSWSLEQTLALSRKRRINRRNENYSEMIGEWKQQHPHGKKIECARDLRISRPTIDKYWDLYDVSQIM